MNSQYLRPFDPLKLKKVYKKYMHVKTIQDDEYYGLLERIYHQLNYTTRCVDNDKIQFECPDVKRRGNSIIWHNFDSCCKIINREPRHLLSFISIELKTTANVGDKGLIIRGRYRVNQLEDLLRKYITEYVSCKACHSLDTILKKENRVEFKCCNTCHCKCSVATLKI